MNETPTPESSTDGRLSLGRLLPWVVGIVGAALASYGAHMHLSIAAKTNCDGCEPWHPLFVLAPLVLGILLVLAAGTARYRS